MKSGNGWDASIGASQLSLIADVPGRCNGQPIDIRSSMTAAITAVRLSGPAKNDGQNELASRPSGRRADWKKRLNAASRTLAARGLNNATCIAFHRSEVI